MATSYKYLCNEICGNCVNFNLKLYLKPVEKGEERKKLCKIKGEIKDIHDTYCEYFDTSEMLKDYTKKEVKQMEKFGHPRFYEILDELAELHSSKNKDYATQNDPLRNFKESGKQCQGLLSEGNEAIKICLVYMQKQIDAVKKLVSEGKKGGVENIATRLKDVAVYSVLGMILFEETFKEENDFDDSVDKFLNQEPVNKFGILDMPEFFKDIKLK